MELRSIDQHFLATKLTIPPVYQDKIISRRRLYGPLERGVQRPILLVSAPAGFGKTTLIAEWLRHKELLAAWVSLEKADNELVRFWHYVVAALCRQQDAIGKQMEILPVGIVPCADPVPGDDLVPCTDPMRGCDPMPRTNPSTAPEAMLAALINALLHLSEDVVLVLDDYQAITNAAIHQSMRFFLEHLPPRLHLLMITRSDPPLALTQLRAQGKLTEIRATDLRLTVDEVRIFLNQIMNLSLTDRQVEDLCQRTEGWMASIQLAALSLTGRDEVSNVQHFIDTCTGRNIQQGSVRGGRGPVVGGQGLVGIEVASVPPPQGQEVRLIETLSEREYSVLRLVSEGLSNQEIARSLVVTVSTVKTHLNNIYAKFQVHTRLQAVTKAYDLGLLGPWTWASPQGL
jgi:LuxR family maltose regulon positive regulatory protein